MRELSDIVNLSNFLNCLRKKGFKPIASGKNRVWKRSEMNDVKFRGELKHVSNPLKVHKIEIFFGLDFEICIISLLVMSKY